MTVEEVVKKVRKDYLLSEDELLKKSMFEFLINRKTEIETDILETFGKYNVKTFSGLERMVKAEREHPAWEDLIILENLYAKLKDIKNDIKDLSFNFKGKPY